jgi:WD40 repeat protein
MWSRFISRRQLVILRGFQGGHIWDSTTGDVRFKTALGHYISTAALSHDGAMPAVAATGEPAQVFDFPSRRLLFRLTSDFSGATALAFSPDGSLIASEDTDTVKRVSDVHTGKLKWRFDKLTREPFTIDFTVDGKFVLAGGPNKSLILLDASNGQAVRSYSKQEDIVRHLEVSLDGSAVAAMYFNENGSNIPAPAIYSTSVPGMSARDGHRTCLSLAAAGSATGSYSSRQQPSVHYKSGLCLRHPSSSGIGRFRQEISIAPRD